mgnify:CR=1 FL=1
MLVFWLIVGALVAFDLAWWAWGDWRLRRLRGSAAWRAGFCAFMAIQAVGFWVLFGYRMIGREDPLPTVMQAAVYVWHLVVAPASIVLLVAGGVGWAAVSAVRWALSGVKASAAAAAGVDGEAGPPSRDEPAAQGPTRRDVILAGLAAVPPVVTAAGVGVGLTQLQGFRIRRMELEIPNLPDALDGLSIAHVSDIHAGRFTPPEKMSLIVEQTNALEPDLVLLTGDIIDFHLSDLPRTIEMIHRLRPKAGMFLCEGNHDLIEDREAFEYQVRRAMLPLLLNESHTIRVGRQAVQVLGLRWGFAGAGRGAFVDENTRMIAGMIRPDAFPILLAHHPHAFDLAAEAGIPLTLAGHTHGGQLMLNERLGAGSIMFKYWSGLYRKGNSSLVVSNGVGNWFPLRVNAPAEIIHLRLKRRTA